MNDFKNSLKTAATIYAQVATADVTGATVDTQGYHAVGLLANVGASGDTLSGSVYVDLEVEHSNDNSTWADCADTDIEGAVTGTTTGTFARINDPAEDVALYKTNYYGGRRYVRVIANLTGTHTNGIPLSVTAVLGEPTYAPV